jgi:twinkle protein
MEAATEGATKTVAEIGGTHRAIDKRGITEESCRKFDYRVAKLNGQLAQIAVYRDASGTVCGHHLRYEGKQFRWTGDAKRAVLWGRHLWTPSPNIRVVVTEGEIDAMTVSQLMDHKWPVVSLPNGAASAAQSIAASSDWLEQFAEVVLMFDSDEPGQKAAKDAAAILSPGKAKIASLPLKDANECLLAGRGSEVITAFWRATPYRPDGIVPGTELWDVIIRDDDREGLPYPWQSMQGMTHGMRKSELVVITAGTGIGKSLVVREIGYHLIQQEQTIGYIALEESTKRTALGLMSCHLDRRLHVDMASEEDLKAAFDATVGSGRVFLYDHFGSLDSDNLLAKIRYMARGMGCEWIILDHISIVVSGMEGGDERRVIDQTMTKLRSLTQELGIGMLVVSHLRRPEGRGHEEGAATSLAQLRGSAAIGQLSDIVVGLERDQQSEDERDVTTVRVLKNRYTGETGIAGYLRYDRRTGRLRDSDNVRFGSVDDGTEIPF